MGCGCDGGCFWAGAHSLRRTARNCCTAVTYSGGASTGTFLMASASALVAFSMHSAGVICGICTA
eukprot:2827332-Ditylum_brightwellii.AAC.1